MSDTETPAPENATKPSRFAHLEKMGAEQGFFEHIGDEHSALFVDRGDTLIVSFDNLDMVDIGDEERLPWGFSFVESRGWSALGVMAQGWTWYRDTAVEDFFDRLRDEGFFNRFKQVIFYGASMGAYAATAYSAAHPGCTVIALSPQATLDREVTIWETRFRKAWRRDFDGRYGYAPISVTWAGQVYLFYDPSDREDAMHAALFSGPNVQKFRCRYMGHRIASLWLSMGILKKVIESCVDGSITRAGLYTLFRSRKTSTRYQKELLDRLRKRGRPDLTARLCRFVLNQGGHRPHFARELVMANRKLDPSRKK